MDDVTQEMINAGKQALRDVAAECGQHFPDELSDEEEVQFTLSVERVLRAAMAVR